MYLHRIEAENYRSLRSVAVDLNPMQVLVGPNGAGKTNLLSVIRFLGEIARRDMIPALEAYGGFDTLFFRGKPTLKSTIRLKIIAQATRYASPTALDEYTLTMRRYPQIIGRTEELTFKRVGGRGRRITVRGNQFELEVGGVRGEPRSLAQGSAALSTLPRLGRDAGGEQVGQLAALFTTFRVFDVDVGRARRPARLRRRQKLEPDASNLAAFLLDLSNDHAEVFDLLQRDLRSVVPGFEALELRPVGGPVEAVEVRLRERALKGATPLADASFGTVRALALLAMLHDPDPPALTCIEEVDHGLHPHAIDRIVHRMRDAARRTQLLVATHSPTFVSRLHPDELIVCERDPSTGASRIPAIGREKIRELSADTCLNLGELWFSGSLGGGLP